MIDDLKLLELGTRVRFSRYLDRATAEIPGTWDRDRKSWTPSPVSDLVPRDGLNGRGEIAGVIVGIRTLSNGVRVWPVEESMRYVAESYFPAVLIAYDLHRKPVLVLPEHVSLVERVTL